MSGIFKGIRQSRLVEKMLSCNVKPNILGIVTDFVSRKKQCTDELQFQANFYEYQTVMELWSELLKTGSTNS